MSSAITVLKKNLRDEVTWQYSGQVLQRGPAWVKLEALFNRADMPFMDTILKKDDRFVETFYSDRGYNIFEIYDRDDGKLKGWYCNIGRPAVILDGSVSYVDLALDLWVSADGRQTVLDEDEFAALDLEPPERALALRDLDELKQWFEHKKPPH